MELTKKHFIQIAMLLAFAFAVGLGLIVLSPDPETAGAQGSSPATRACVNASTTIVALGHQASTVIVGTSSLRAYTYISQPASATNTVSIHFGYGAPATLYNGQILDHASTSAAVVRVDTPPFGLNTSFPYTGAVTARSHLGTTSVLVTNCTY